MKRLANCETPFNQLSEQSLAMKKSNTPTQISKSDIDNIILRRIWVGDAQRRSSAIGKVFREDCYIINLVILQGKIVFVLAAAPKCKSTI